MGVLTILRVIYITLCYVALYYITKMDASVVYVRTVRTSLLLSFFWS